MSDCESIRQGFIIAEQSASQTSITANETSHHPHQRLWTLYHPGDGDTVDNKQSNIQEDANGMIGLATNTATHSLPVRIRHR